MEEHAIVALQHVQFCDYVTQYLRKPLDSLILADIIVLTISRNIYVPRSNKYNYYSLQLSLQLLQWAGLSVLNVCLHLEAKIKIN